MLSAAASAQQQTHTVPIQSPVLTGTWSTTVSVPKFDTSLGHLLYVRVLLSGSVTGSFGVENTGANPTGILAYTGAQVTANHPGVAGVGINPAFENNPTPLAAYDGTVDYAGTSGETFAFTGATGTGAPSNMTPVTGPYSVDAFRGPPGAPGTIDFQIQAWEFIGLVFPPMVADAQLSVSAGLTVEYNYSTVSHSICSTEMFNGGWGGCPCSTFGALGSGCPNSVFAAGATLSASGTASIANDTLVLSAASMSGSSSIFLQGDELTDSVTFFGDGLRCVSGNLIRLGTGVNTAGASSYPSPAQLSVSVRGSIAAPGTRYYQTYYRNAAAFCTPDTFNITNGVALHWAP